MISLTPFYGKYLIQLSMNAKSEIFFKSIAAGGGFAVLMVLITFLVFKRAEIK